MKRQGVPASFVQYSWLEQLEHAKNDGGMALGLSSEHVHQYLVADTAETTEDSDAVGTIRRKHLKLQVSLSQYSSCTLASAVTRRFIYWP